MRAEVLGAFADFQLNGPNPRNVKFIVGIENVIFYLSCDGPICPERGLISRIMTVSGDNHPVEALPVGQLADSGPFPGFFNFVFGLVAPTHFLKKKKKLGRVSKGMQLDSNERVLLYILVEFSTRAVRIGTERMNCQWRLGTEQGTEVA